MANGNCPQPSVTDAFRFDEVQSLRRALRGITFGNPREHVGPLVATAQARYHLRLITSQEECDRGELRS